MMLSQSRYGQGPALPCPELPALDEAAAQLFEAPRAYDVRVGLVRWEGATGEWTFTYGGSSTIGGPSGLGECAASAVRHGFRADTFLELADGVVVGILYARDWSK